MARSKPGPSSLPPGGAGTTILVVDDDAEMRAYMAQCLSPLGFTIVQSRDGLDALQKIDEDLGKTISLVVADVHLPGMGGREVKAAMQADHHLAEIPVLLISGGAMDDRDGPSLSKPFNATLLSSAVRELITTPHIPTD